MKKKGSRIEVMNGIAEMTGGGLKKKDLMYKDGKIISKKMNKIKIYKQRGGEYEVCKKLAYDVYNALHKDKQNLKLNENDSVVLEYITKNKKIGDDVLTGNNRSDFIKYIVKSRSELRPKPPEYKKCEEFLSELKINNTSFYSHYKNEINKYLRSIYIGDYVVNKEGVNRRLWKINKDKSLLRKLEKNNKLPGSYKWLLEPGSYKKLIEGDEIEMNGDIYIYRRSKQNNDIVNLYKKNGTKEIISKKYTEINLENIYSN